MVVLGVVLAAGVALAVVVVLVKVVPPWVASTDHLSGKNRAEEIGRARTAFLAILAGGLATVGAVFTGLSYRLNRQGHELDRAGQITERFTRAIDQLGSRELDVRLGGIYALERIARDSRDDHPQVMEVLTAYLRQHTPWPPKDAPPKPFTGEEPSTDVHGVVTVLGRRVTSQDTRPLDLRSVDLRSARLTKANLEKANLRGANLEKADLEGANLRGARLDGANLQDATLKGANLRGAHLDRANLQDATLTRADLQNAHLDDADLQNARLDDAELQSAFLRGANLQRAALQRANLRYAILERADLNDAVYDAGTQWPEGFKPEDHGARLAHGAPSGISDSVPPPD
jgi:uncharacterized protein YjbI with pentapeptide repeats